MDGTIEAYRAEIEASELSPERKERILELLSVEPLTEEAVEEIEDIIAAAIDEDVAQDPELIAALAEDPELQAETAAIEAEILGAREELARSMQEFDSQSQELESAMAEVDAIVSAERLEELKAKLGQG